MKTTIMILISSALLLLTGCYLNQSGSLVNAYVFIDKTDSLTVSPMPDQILALYGFDQSIYNGGIFEISTLTNVSFNQVQQVKIDRGSYLSSNRFIREQQINDFKESVRTSTTKALKTPTGANNSSIFYPLFKGLNSLAQAEGDKKVALIYSDMNEHSWYIDFYHSKVLQEIQDNPDRVQQLLESQVPLQSLSGITIYFLYIPKNPKDDERYKIVANFFANIFRSKGATVVISPSIQN